MSTKSNQTSNQTSNCLSDNPLIGKLRAGLLNNPEIREILDETEQEIIANRNNNGSEHKGLVSSE